MNRISRRSAIKAVALAATLPRSIFGQGASEKISAYLESLARNDGGYGWAGQEHSHLTPTFFVIGSYRLLKQTPPRKAQLTEFVRTHHPAALKKLEQERRIFEWQQLQALVWLNATPPADLREKILGWKQPLAYLKQYERHGYPLFSSEMGVVLSRQLLGVSELPQAFVDYLNSRRRVNGSFNNTPASDNSDGHVMSTWWGLQALQTLGRANELQDQTIAWLRSSQLPNGGFTYSARPEFGGIDDVAYTWAACRALKLLAVKPANPAAAIGYLQSLFNEDGGFADRPGWSSTPMATYYALDALNSLEASIPTTVTIKRGEPKPPLPSRLKVFSIQLEAHGQGSPVETVHLARSLKIHLWGAKNAKPDWLARTQALADETQTKVKFFRANEEYGTWFELPGFGTYSHTSDIIAPARSDIGPSLVGQEAVTWQEFRERRLVALQKGKGRLVWQFGENEELVRALLDDSLQRPGYAAISTYHFGNPDFTNSEPFLHRWRGQIPFVALQDAHGPEPWWFADMTTGFRTLFLAEEPTWEAWPVALENNWVVPVRRDQWTSGKTWFHAPTQEILNFVRARESDWRWWNNEKVQRPLISIVAVRPQDQYEAARPEKGITLRIRCAWQNTPQGLLKEPITQFTKLTVDGGELPTELFSKRRPNGLLDDHYHFARLENLKEGKHSAIVHAQILESKKEVTESLEFTV